MARAKRKREEWDFLVYVLPNVGSGILRASVAEWKMSPTSKGRPFIQFRAQMPDSNVYRFLVMPNSEKFWPKPEVVEKMFDDLETRLKEKSEEALKKKEERRAAKEAEKNEK